jgi:uncharacterized paraquat-inducible protein A
LRYNKKYKLYNYIAKGKNMTEKEKTEPKRYKCDECGLVVPAEDVRWSKKEHRALCPRCEWPLDPIVEEE